MLQLKLDKLDYTIFYLYLCYASNFMPIFYFMPLIYRKLNA